MTYGDIIRKMTDEELAETVTALVMMVLPIDQSPSRPMTEALCRKFITDFVTREVPENVMNVLKKKEEAADGLPVEGSR